MDIVYILGTGSKWDNNELRYSLRSIEKFGKNVGRIFVVGEDPGFLSREVILVNYPDSTSDKHKNMLTKICAAVEYTNIGDHFLKASDDHFYVKETDFDNYPIYCRGELPNKVPEDSESKGYQQSLVDTRNLLEKYDYPCYYFSWHGLSHIYTEAIKLAKDLIEESYDTQKGCEPTCLLLNVLYKYKPFEFTKRKDLKIKGDIQGVEAIKEKIGDREVFSIYDDAINKGVAEYLQELFPNKSKYEL